MKKISTTILMLLIAATAFAKAPKYVFYFIGDGMGPSHILCTEMYMGEMAGMIGRPQKLCFTEFPHTAFMTTFSASNGVTDSAASGTALSTGNKTRNGHLGVTPDSLPVYSVALAAKQAGYAVGISTTCPINHATPGAFYAHQPSRNNYHKIAQEMLVTGYEFFAGGDPICNDEQRTALYEQAGKDGYAIARGINDYKAKCDNAEKIMLYQKDILTQVPYTIDRTADDLTLAQITEAGIDFLTKKNNKGFFFMIEGGKIDYAGHSDDAATMMQEVMDLHRAVEVAIEFYKKHKDETLIIVTADHETGGLVLGYNHSYTLNLKALSGQKVSGDRMEEILLARSRQGNMEWNDVQTLLRENMGLWDEAKIDEEQTQRLKDMFTHAYAADNSTEQREKGLRAIADKAKYLVSHAAALSWAGGNHSATFVPVFAIGAGAEKFDGVLDNTDIPKIIMKIARY